MREDEWASWMRAAIAGDADAYRHFLQALTPHLRAMARRRCEQMGMPRSDAEDLVQEALLTIHVKRGSWDAARPIGPWISAIVRNKLIDSLRRRGRTIHVPIDDVMETLEAEDHGDGLDHIDVERLVMQLREPQQSIVRAVSLAGASIRDTALKLGMSEGAVRVALHRALKTLAALYRSEVP